MFVTVCTDSTYTSKKNVSPKHESPPVIVHASECISIFSICHSAFMHLVIVCSTFVCEISITFH